MKKTRQLATILLIEDDPDVRFPIVEYLEHLGYKVVTAADGMKGLKRLRKGGYDLVITDVVMPYVSGLGVVTALKEKDPHIPVIAITGYGKEPETAAMEKKADLVLAKPIKMTALKNYAAQLLTPKDRPR